MNQSFVKMMNRIAEIENHILKGLVLDEHGQWIPIADKRAVEEDFLAHLAAGRILHEGRWVSIAEARAARTPAEIATAVVDLGSKPESGVVTENAPAVEEKATGPAEFPGEETRGVFLTRSPEEETRTSAAPPEQGIEFPPETKSIIIAPAIDPVSGFAPETGYFVVDQTDNSIPARKGMDGAPVPEPLSSPEKEVSSVIPVPLTSWEKDAQKRRKTVLLIGGAIAAITGIGAVLIIVFQVIR